MYSGGAFRARYTNTNADVVRNGSRISKNSHDGSRMRPMSRG
jgi:hypothetical protein